MRALLRERDLELLRCRGTENGPVFFRQAIPDGKPDRERERGSVTVETLPRCVGRGFGDSGGKARHETAGLRRKRRPIRKRGRRIVRRWGIVRFGAKRPRRVGPESGRGDTQPGEIREAVDRMPGPEWRSLTRMAGQQGFPAMVSRKVVPEHLPSADRDPVCKILGAEAAGTGQPAEIGEGRMQLRKRMHRAMHQIGVALRALRGSSHEFEAIAPAGQRFDAPCKALRAVGRPLGRIGPGHRQAKRGAGL